MYQYFLSAYAISPCFKDWDPKVEAQFLTQLMSNEKICGLEIPLFPEGNTRYPLDWLAKLIPDHWQIHITTLPHTMNRQQSTPGYGLVAAEQEKQDLYLQEMGCCLDQIHRLNQKLKRQAISRIHLHTAPPRQGASSASLQESMHHGLNQLVKRQDSIELSIEHCDAIQPNQTYDKGFLSLEDELAVCQQFENIQMTLNWGRSVIEARSVDQPIAQILRLQQQKRLAGFYFSGCTNKKDSVYGKFKDSHCPPYEAGLASPQCQGSLLNSHQAQRVFQALNQKVQLGLKIYDASLSTQIEDKLKMIKQSIAILERLL